MLHDPIRRAPASVAGAHRLFFALSLPPTLARQLANAAGWFRDTGRAVAAERLHLTLFILPDFADYPATLIKYLRDVGVAVSMPPVEILLDYVSGGGRSIALRPQHRIAGLNDLHRDLARLCLAAGIAGRPDYDFQPHVTLGYRPGSNVARPFGERVPPVGWTATEFVLIHSLLGHTKHKTLGRWPLTGRAETQLELF